MQKIIDNLGITISAACAIHCVLLPAILIIAPYSFFASHEFHETLIYFIHIVELSEWALAHFFLE